MPGSDAWRPSLRLAFEAAARVASAREAAPRRPRLPEDDEAFAIVEGMLRADAALTATGVSLSVEVDAMAGAGSGRHGAGPFGRRRRPAELAVSGGILVDRRRLARRRAHRRWRAGRRVRLPVQLRRPSRYLDPGVPDYERALARRGTTLVGTVKSGALVEVARRAAGWSTKRRPRARVRAPRDRADASAAGAAQSAAIVAAIVIGDRAGLDDDVQRRLQEAGTYHVIAISGGNIAILAGLLLGGVPPRRHARPDRDARRRSPRCWRTRGWSAAARRSIARR